MKGLRFLSRYTMAAILVLCGAAALSAETRVHYTITATVSVSPTTREDVIAWLDKNGGYFVYNANTQLTLKVPVKLVPGLKKTLEQYSRSVVAYTLNSNSIEQDYQAAKAAIASREDILKSTIGFIQQANVKGALALEQETSSIIGELEHYKGTLRVLDNETAFAELTLNLQAPALRQVDAQPSSFAWINEIDFYSFMGKRFQ